MISLSTGVLATGVAISSPALYAWLVEGTMSAEVALTRCAIAVVVCWVALSVVVDLAFSPPAPSRQPEERRADDTATSRLPTAQTD